MKLRKDVAVLLAILRPLAEGKEDRFFHSDYHSYAEELEMGKDARRRRANETFLHGRP